MNTSQKILSDITVFNKYAKYIPEIGRRETWDELCDRNQAMHTRKYPVLKNEIKEVYDNFVRPKKVLPSMRSLQFAGLPIELANNRVFNCAYLPVEDVHAFSETMFLLLGGTGVGYSVQDRHVSKLPVIVGPKDSGRRFLIGDSIEGWADSIKVLMRAYVHGKSNPVFDFRDIRPKGARLITSGGKAPGPDPLKACLENIRRVLDKALGRKLTSLEVHDIQCHIADAVLAGGIRRAAMICLFDKHDVDMLTCKGMVSVDDWDMSQQEDGQWVGYCTYKGDRHPLVLGDDEYTNTLVTDSALPWYFFEPQRGRANNSVALDRATTTREEFDGVWQRVIDSNAGEPGIYWTNDLDWGTNPCVEIGLRPYQFCNLVEINASDVCTQEDLNARAAAAAFLGTLQAGYTDFHYLRSVWKETTEKDALLGVSMTGIASGGVLGLDLKEAATIVKEVNAHVADIININRAARTTAVKPAGTTSLVVGSSSGIHAWHNDYYIRRMRVGKNEALYSYVKKEIPELIEDCYFKPNLEAVMSFPQKAPDGAIIRTESYIDLLERVKLFNQTWVREGHVDGANHHNVSCTIALKQGEWWACGSWMWNNRYEYNGISVLNYDGGTYKQPPFEDITKEDYERMETLLKTIDLTKVVEETDNTQLSDNLACSGNSCEVI